MRAKIAIKLLSVLIALISFVTVVEASGLPLRVSVVKGVARMTDLRDDYNRMDLAENMPLFVDQEVSTEGHSWVEIDYGGSVFIRLDEWSRMRIVGMRETASEAVVEVRLVEGNLYMRDFGRRGFRVDVLGDDVKLIPEGVVSLSVRNRVRGIEAEVWSGSVRVIDRTGSWHLEEGVEVISNGYGETETAPLNYPDEWVRWNFARDRITREYYAIEDGFLPPLLSDYSGFLGRYGEWVEDPYYGYVWVPAEVPLEWVPYSRGRWVEIREEYVWVPSEPWGWIPYHYGRWVYVDHRGWCWVPPGRPAVWSPALVVWYSDDLYLGWFPLGPGEFYTGPPPVRIIKEKIIIKKTIRHYRNGRIRRAVIKRKRRALRPRKVVVYKEKKIFVEKKRRIKKREYRREKDRFIRPHHRKERGQHRWRIAEKRVVEKRVFQREGRKRKKTFHGYTKTRFSVSQTKLRFKHKKGRDVFNKRKGKRFKKVVGKSAEDRHHKGEVKHRKMKRYKMRGLT